MTPNRPPGLYEELITRRLEAALEEIRGEGRRDEVEQLDPAGAPGVLARFVHDLVEPLRGSLTATPAVQTIPTTLDRALSEPLTRESRRTPPFSQRDATERISNLHFVTRFKTTTCEPEHCLDSAVTLDN